LTESVLIAVLLQSVFSTLSVAIEKFMLSQGLAD
jgi:hypothetical protein